MKKNKKKTAKGLLSQKQNSFNLKIDGNKLAEKVSNYLASCGNV